MRLQQHNSDFSSQNTVSILEEFMQNLHWKFGQRTPSAGTLGLFRDDGLNYIFFRNKTLKAEIFSICLKRISWNLTKFQLNQTTDRKSRNKNCLKELKFCQVWRNCFSIRCWKFQFSILKNKNKLFLKRYDLGRSL